MYIYKFVVEAEKEDVGMFSGEVETRRDTSEHYIAAYSVEHGRNHVKASVERAGWKVIDIRAYDIYVHDIRDVCDHITD